MKIDRKDSLTLRVLDDTPNGTWLGAPRPDAWWEMMEWARKNDIVCRRGRSVELIFERDEDITAFVLRWA